MSEMAVLNIVREGIKTVLYVAAPPLLLGLAVGVIVSIFQTVTSIQEPTLAFVPKIVAVFLSLIVFGNWMLGQLMAFITTLYKNLPMLMAK